MTDAEFDAFMAKLLRTVDRDAQGLTRLAKRYDDAQTPRPDATQSDHTSDVEFHRYNDEPWKD